MTSPEIRRTIALHIAVDHPAFAGHFPGRPLLPGVALLAQVFEAVLADSILAAAVGPCPRIAQAKFLAPVGPGAQLELQLVCAEHALHFDVRLNQRSAASGRIQRGEPVPPRE